MLEVVIYGPSSHSQYRAHVTKVVLMHRTVEFKLLPFIQNKDNPYFLKKKLSENSNVSQIKLKRCSKFNSVLHKGIDRFNLSTLKKSTQ